MTPEELLDMERDARTAAKHYRKSAGLVVNPEPGELEELERLASESEAIADRYAAKVEAALSLTEYYVLMRRAHTYYSAVHPRMRFSDSGYAEKLEALWNQGFRGDELLHLLFNK